jgi:hypothetical protein
MVDMMPKENENLDTFDVYYRKESNFSLDKGLVHGDIADLYVRVASIVAKNLDNVYYKMQGEIWSPKGEAEWLIRTLGLDHTSMSIGDVAHNTKTGEYWQVNRSGWKQVPYIKLCE